MADPVQFVVGNPSFQAAGTQRNGLSTEQGGHLVSVLDPSLHVYSRMGRVFSVTTTVATAVAPLQVVPTTTAAFVLNNVATDGRLLVIVAAGFINGSGTSDKGGALYGQVGSAPLGTQLTADATGVVKSSNR